MAHEEKPPGERPLEDPKVKVKVEPRRGADREQSDRNRDYGKKVERSIERDVKKALDDHRGGGVEKQVDAAKKAVQDAGKIDQVRKGVDKIDVQIDGKVGDKKVSIPLPPVKPEEPKK